MQQQPDISAYANTFAQHGALTLSNLLPEDLVKALQDDFDNLDWVLQVKDYSQSHRLEVPVKDIKNRNNLIEVLYSHQHTIDLNNLFYIRLAVASEDLQTDALNQASKFFNSDNFINTCKNIVKMPDITQTWLEATCYDKGCFLGNHRDDHHPDNRVAFVYNLSRNWKIDWGGLLMIENTPGQQPLIVPPMTNSLSMFRIPVNHTVTSVSQAATEHRYSITGWLRP